MLKALLVCAPVDRTTASLWMPRAAGLRRAHRGKGTRLAAKDAAPAKDLRCYSMRDVPEPSTERDDHPQRDVGLPSKERRVTSFNHSIDQHLPSRLMSEADTARLLNMSPSAFSRKAAQLEQQLGMPARHPGLKRRDSVAIHAWLNRLFGVREKQTNVSDLVRQRMGALRDGNRAD